MAYTPQSQGAQKPEKYPFLGANYLHWGEQPGFIYDPYRDAYMPDKNAAQGYYQSAGLLPPPLPGGEVKVGPDGRTYSLQNGQWVDVTPKPPGLIEQVAPLGAAALAVEGGKQIGAGLLGGGISLPSIGGGASTTAATTGSGLLGTGGTAAATGGAQATGAGSVLAGGQAAGAGAGQATSGMVGTFPGGFGLLPAAGIAAGAFTGYQQGRGLMNAVKGKDMSLLQETALALPTFGLSYAWDPIKNAFGWGDQDKWKTEGNRLRAVGAPQVLIDSMPTRGRSFDEMQRKDMAADFIGFDPSGQWVNNKFNMSRDVADLRGTDLQGYAAFAENDPTWFQKSLEERTRIAQAALDAGAVREHHGTIDVDWNKFTPPQAGPAPKPVTPMPKPNNGSPGMRPKRREALRR